MEWLCCWVSLVPMWGTSGGAVAVLLQDCWFPKQLCRGSMQPPHRQFFWCTQVSLPKEITSPVLHCYLWINPVVLTLTFRLNMRLKLLHMKSLHFIKGAFWWSGNNVINQKDPRNTNASPSLELCYQKKYLKCLSAVHCVQNQNEERQIFKINWFVKNLCALY